MRALSSEALLALAERGAGVRVNARALLALNEALPQLDPATLWNQSLAQRDAALLELRRLTFGDRMQCVARCPSCDEALEFELSASALLDRAQLQFEAPIEIELDGACFRLRQPSLSELAAAEPTDLPGAARRIVQNCLIGPAVADALLPALQAAFAQRLADLLPLNDPRIGLECPACGAVWDECFDVATHLWSDIDAAAIRLLHEVHALALAYHWSEADILALPRSRRRFYLECVGA